MSAVVTTCLETLPDGPAVADATDMLEYFSQVCAFQPPHRKFTCQGLRRLQIPIPACKCSWTAPARASTPPVPFPRATWCCASPPCVQSSTTTTVATHSYVELASAF